MTARISHNLPPDPVDDGLIIEPGATMWQRIRGRIDHVPAKLAATVAMGAAALSLTGCLPSSAQAEGTPDHPTTSSAPATPVSPSASETQPTKATSPEQRPKSKYDSSVTAHMTPEEITKYYQLPVSDLKDVNKLVNRFTSASEGLANIGCSKEIWDSYGNELTLDTRAVAGDIATKYGEAAETGLFGQPGTSQELLSNVAFTCSATRSLNVDGKNRPEYFMKYTVIPNTTETSHNPDGSIKSISWNVAVSDTDTLDKDISNLAKIAPTDFVYQEEVTNPRPGKGFDGTEKIVFDSTRAIDIKQSSAAD